MKNPVEEIKDERDVIVLTVDDWIAVERIIKVLPKIYGICQRNRILYIIEDEGIPKLISHGKLRHYIGTVCRFFNERGQRVHPTNRIISGVRNHGVYPGIQSID